MSSLEKPNVDYPPIPAELPSLAWWEWPLTRLPSWARPVWRLEELFICDLAHYAPSLPDRPELRVDHITDSTAIKAEHAKFMIRHTGRLVWRMHRRRIRTGRCHLFLTRLNGNVINYMFVQFRGRALRPYRALMRQPALMLGPSLTAPQARGQGVYTYALRYVLAEIKQARYRWAYGWASSSNQPSLRGITKSGMVHIGTFLCHRGASSRRSVVAANIVRPDLTALGQDHDESNERSRGGG